MAVFWGVLLGTLAAMGVICAIVLYLLKKLDNQDHWVWANFATVALRGIFVIPQLWGSAYFLMELGIVLGIYLLEQAVWFLYDYIQERRQQQPAGWGLIFGIIIGGLLWMFALKLITFYISQAVSA